ncbi:hypothetical protein [Amycolatopsis sp. WQ 127309]|nr:hypothetical protein [Amycolatopsis sp. WQ 127309]UOZ06178.1 hypothetical protein MUY22_46470 [Amycolatopsis sp. WQ 127309]
MARPRRRANVAGWAGENRASVSSSSAALWLTAILVTPAGVRTREAVS